MSQMGGGVVFAVGDCFFFFFHRSYSIIGFQEVWFESTEIEVVVHREHVQAMVRDRKTCLPVDSLWWIECHWVQFIRATRGRVLFPFAFLLFFAKWLKANLYFLRFEINLFLLFAEGKVSWTV